MKRQVRHKGYSLTEYSLFTSNSGLLGCGRVALFTLPAVVVGFTVHGVRVGRGSELLKAQASIVSVKTSRWISKYYLGSIPGFRLVPIHSEG